MDVHKSMQVSASKLGYELRNVCLYSESSIFREFRKSHLPFYWKYKFVLIAEVIDSLLIRISVYRAEFVKIKK